MIAAIAIAMASAAEPRLEHLAAVVPPDGAGFEIPAYDSAARVVWATRTDRPRLSRLSLADPAAPVLLSDIDLSAYGGAITSVAAHEGLVAATVLATRTTDDGTLVLLDADGTALATAGVGPHPDMVAFTPDGSRLLIANEGEPAGGIDPPGSVTVIDLQRGPGGVSVTGAVTLQLGNPDAPSVGAGWFTPIGNTPPALVEPEYIALSPDGSRAYVTCQENNGVAVIDLGASPPRVERLIDLGLMDHAEPSRWIDAVDDERLELAPSAWRSLPQPDGIAAVSVGGSWALVTADEGDPSEGWGPAHEVDGVEAAASADGATVLFGSRSVSLWAPELVRRDSVVSPATRWLLEHGGPTGRDAVIDRRSDRRGEEPEGVAAWVSGGTAYAAVGMERAGAVVLLRVDADRLTALDTHWLGGESGATVPGPEGLVHVPPRDDGTPRLLVVADEALGSLVVLAVREGEADR